MSRNCWEIFFCGREPNGFNVEKYGICPAASTEMKEAKNNGESAGRYCWQVAGTFSGTDVQGTNAKAIGSCFACKFYNHVKNQEGDKFVHS